jgi:demethylmenaquinone methyltransferase/2-methoxy-6-polyprenyl-1,4-benzoquinol methylase
MPLSNVWSRASDEPLAASPRLSILPAAAPPPDLKFYRVPGTFLPAMIGVSNGKMAKMMNSRDTLISPSPSVNRTSVADPERVRRMFGAIAARYDLANHVLSCGFDFYWRKRVAEIVAAWRPNAIVDLATGTGDLALALQKRIPNAKVVGADFSEEMLAVAKRKGVSETVLANAMQLPFGDGSFDLVTISFGLRNLPDWSGALSEMRRVLRPGGHLLVLEFSLPRLSILRAIYRIYLHRITPIIGSILTNEKTAYDYLGDSIEEFPNGEAMLRLLEANGFASAKAEPLTGGIVTIYTAER